MKTHTFILLLLTALLVPNQLHAVACASCKKQLYPGCHILDCKCGCRPSSSRCLCLGSELCSTCKQRQEQERQRAAMGAKRAAIRKQIADIQAQLNALSLSGNRAALEASLRRAEGVLRMIQTSSELDASAKASLRAEAMSKIASLQAKLDGQDAEKKRLLDQLRALENELGQTLNQ